jgi:hypothetical protein
MRKSKKKESVFNHFQKYPKVPKRIECTEWGNERDISWSEIIDEFQKPLYGKDFKRSYLKTPHGLVEF